MMSRSVVIFLASLCLSGCFAAGGIFPAKPLDRYTTAVGASQTDAQIKAAADQDMAEALQFCRGVLNYYERSAKKSSLILSGIAVTGALAGAVIVPALSASSSSMSAIAAWGGASGVANAAQSSITGQSLGPASFLSTRSQIAANIERTITKYYTATTNTDRANTILDLYGSCIANDITASAPQ